MSKIKVNTVAPRSGTTVTLGESGDTIALGCGASQSGFGRTGTVDWCTTAKTSPLTAVSGKGYFINTTGGAITVTLPSSPSAGDIVALKDYAGTWGTACKALTIGRNSSKLDGTCADSVRDTKNESITLVYVDGTRGWKSVEEGTGYVGETFICASGGTITTSGDFKIHTFTSDGTFTVNSLGSSAPNNNVSYMVVAGGGGGGAQRAGGGGAGGFREGKTSSTPYTASPLVAPAGLPVSVQEYPITVGGGGTGGTQAPAPITKGGSGGNSVFSTITSAGGGGGGTQNPSYFTGDNGGSGGGAGAGSTGGTGNTPPVSPPQGSNGGSAPTPSTPPLNSAAGGGGATAAGQNAQPSVGGAGGAGASTEISGSAVVRAGGGGAGASGNGPDAGGAGGSGGGGAGGANPESPTTPSPASAGAAGTANTGGGGGGGGETPTGPYGSNNNGGVGGSGVVIIRYKFQ